MTEEDEVARRVEQLLSLLDRDSRPNVNALWRIGKDIEGIKLNIKFFGYALAQQLAAALPPATAGAVEVGLGSKISTQADVESRWFSHWMAELKLPVLYLRKLWEYAYVLQALHEGRMLEAPRRGLGFGVGAEPIASYLASRGVSCIVSDLPAEDVRAAGWGSTRQHADSLERAFKPELISRDIFDGLVSHRSVDMNHIPAELSNEAFDFCWSICALEHLGSIFAGQEFLLNSLHCVKPGGLSIHTLEYNCLSNDRTIDNSPTVLFLRRHIEDLVGRLIADGHQVAPLDFGLGLGLIDRFIDLPPFEIDVDANYRSFVSDGMQHLKVACDGFVSTCFGLIIRKAEDVRKVNCR